MELWKLRKTGEFTVFIRFVFWISLLGFFAIRALLASLSLNTVTISFLLFGLLVYIFYLNYNYRLEDARRKAGLCPECGKDGHRSFFNCQWCGYHEPDPLPRLKKTLQELERNDAVEDAIKRLRGE